jgi:hypothetical protein
MSDLLIGDGDKIPAPETVLRHDARDWLFAEVPFDFTIHVSDFYPNRMQETTPFDLPNIRL